MKRLLAVLLFLMTGSLTILTGSHGADAASATAISSAEIAGDRDSANISLAMSGQPHFNIFYLVGPDRIVIDMTKIDWQASAPAAKPGALVSNLRHGTPTADQSRLVLDLTAPARVTSARYVTDKKSGKVKLQIALSAVSEANFREAANAKAPAKAVATTTAARTTPAAAPSAAQAEAAANFQTAAGGAAAGGVAVGAKARPMPTLTQAPAPAQVASAQPAKQVYRQPLLTSADTELVEEAQQSSRDSNGLGYTGSDGVFVTYMHPPGSLIGGGVTVGTSF